MGLIINTNRIKMHCNDDKISENIQFVTRLLRQDNPSFYLSITNLLIVQLKTVNLLCNLEGYVIIREYCVLKIV